jgi:hypothetical protein
MPKRTFKPLPQTVRTAEGQLFRCLYRVEWTALGPGEREWDELFMPFRWGEDYAKDLTKAQAEECVAWHRSRPHGKMFEYKIEPMKEPE